MVKVRLNSYSGEKWRWHIDLDGVPVQGKLYSTKWAAKRGFWRWFNRLDTWYTCEAFKPVGMSYKGEGGRVAHIDFAEPDIEFVEE